MSSGIGSLFYILCIIIDIAYCMAMTLIASNVFLMLYLGVSNVVSMLSIHGICVAALGHVVVTKLVGLSSNLCRRASKQYLSMHSPLASAL